MADNGTKTIVGEFEFSNLKHTRTLDLTTHISEKGNIHILDTDT